MKRRKSGRRTAKKGYRKVSKSYYIQRGGIRL